MTYRIWIKDGQKIDILADDIKIDGKMLLLIKNEERIAVFNLDFICGYLQVEHKDKVSYYTKAADVIKEFRELNPNATISQCSKETGISRPTIYKYWNMGMV